MDEGEQEVIEQTMITLPFLTEEVPALYLADGRSYIPVFAVCHALGIRPDTHIRRWRNLLLWVTARKLPFQTRKQGKRLVWCLLISEVPFLYSLFDWKLVSPDQRLQLHRATLEQVRLADLAYQHMQREYKAMRQALFTFLTTCADIDALFDRYTNVLVPTLDDESAPALTVLLARGRSLFQEATAHARKMLHDQGVLPIVDAVKIDADNNVIDTLSMPLLPIVPHEDSKRFFALMEQLTSWMCEERAFWSVLRRVVQQRANELRRLSCEETIPNRALAEMMRCERRPALGALTDWKENERQGKTWLASQRPAGNGLVTGQSRFQDGVIHQDKGEGHRRRPSPQFRLATERLSPV